MVPRGSWWLGWTLLFCAVVPAIADQLEDVKRLSSRLKDARVELERSATILRTAFDALDGKVNELQDQLQMLQEKEKDLTKREAVVKDREEQLYHHSADVQKHYAEQQEEKRRKSRDSAAYSVAYYDQDDALKDKWQDVISSVQQLSQLPHERFVRATNGSTYPLVLLFITSADTRLKLHLKDDHVQRCRNMLSTDGKLVLIVLYKDEDKEADSIPEGLDDIVEFSIKTGFAKAPHKLIEERPMNRGSADKLKRLFKQHVPDPPVIGHDCLFSHLFPTWFLAKVKVPGCNQVQKEQKGQNDEL